MRKCKFNTPEYKRVYNNAGGYSHTDVIDHWREGVFHQWGSDYEEFETGPGNHTIGIVETGDGAVHMANPENIVFLDKEDK